MSRGVVASRSVSFYCVGSLQKTVNVFRVNEGTAVCLVSSENGLFTTCVLQTTWLVKLFEFLRTRRQSAADDAERVHHGVDPVTHEFYFTVGPPDQPVCVLKKTHAGDQTVHARLQDTHFGVPLTWKLVAKSPRAPTAETLYDPRQRFVQLGSGALELGPCVFVMLSVLETLYHVARAHGDVFHTIHFGHHHRRHHDATVRYESLAQRYAQHKKLTSGDS